MMGNVMGMLELRTLDAKIARARKLVAEYQRRVRVPYRLDDVAKSRELLNDLTYWLRKLETHRKNLLRQSRLDDAKSQRYARENAA